jgi:hypothetical protein
MARPSPKQPNAPKASPAAAGVPPEKKRRRIGPRGLNGIFGWTFFDPANLVSIALLGTAAALSVHTLRTRDGADGPMAVLMYLCMAGLLRGYFYTYYHGGAFGRVLILLGNLVGLLGSAALWIDRAEAFSALRSTGLVKLADSPALRWAGTLHLVVGGTLALHLLVPRRWMIKATDEIADLTGRDSAHDAPLESIDDPVARAARAAEIAAQAQRLLDRDSELLAQVERGVRRVTGRRAKGHTDEEALVGSGTGETAVTGDDPAVAAEVAPTDSEPPKDSPA